MKEWQKLMLTKPYKNRVRVCKLFFWVGAIDYLLGANLHWFNDAILIYGGIGLYFVLAVKAKEETEK